MEHYYQKIQGWFNFEGLYTSMVNRFPSGSHFVEIGCWLGKSAVYMGVEIANSGKQIKFDCVDTFEGSPEHIDFDEIKNKELYAMFLKNTQPLRHIINPIKMSSVNAASLYEDESLDFVEIDAAHEGDAISEDIACWYPKVKYGGVLAGHDYDFVPVREAVTAFFKGKEFTKLSCQSWFHNKVK